MAPKYRIGVIAAGRISSLHVVSSLDGLGTHDTEVSAGL